MSEKSLKIMENLSRMNANELPREASRACELAVTTSFQYGFQSILDILYKWVHMCINEGYGLIMDHENHGG